MNARLRIAHSGYGIGVIWERNVRTGKVHRSHLAWAFFWGREHRESWGRRFKHRPSEADDEYVIRIVADAATLWLNDLHYLHAPEAGPLIDGDTTAVENRYSMSLIGALRGVALEAPDLMRLMEDSVTDPEFSRQCRSAANDARQIDTRDVGTGPILESAPRKAS